MDAHGHWGKVIFPQNSSRPHSSRPASLFTCVFPGACLGWEPNLLLIVQLVLHKPHRPLGAKRWKPQDGG